MASDVRERPFASSLPRATPGWRWSQQWRDVLFLHWPADESELCGQLPAGLQIDTLDGRAWVSFVGFRLQGIRFYGWPALPLCSQMLELNFRTYVTYRGEPAIYFLTMHANHRWMIAAARWLTPLPYEFASLHYQCGAAGGEFVCREQGSDQPMLSASFRLGRCFNRSQTSSLDCWLTERYVAYASAEGRLFRMQVEHQPWPLRNIELQQCAHQQQTAEQPVCHYSDGVSSLLSTFQSVG
jgi:uncharacterized protein YqjF (DUF2071 family)